MSDTPDTPSEPTEDNTRPNDLPAGVVPAEAAVTGAAKIRRGKKPLPAYPMHPMARRIHAAGSVRATATVKARRVSTRANAQVKDGNAKPIRKAPHQKVKAASKGGVASKYPDMPSGLTRNQAKSWRSKARRSHPTPTPVKRKPNSTRRKPR